MKTQQSQSHHDEFRVIKREKENLNPQAKFSKSIEDKLHMMQRNVQDQSLNDQYLLSSLDTKKNHLTSVSFNLQSTDQAFIYSQDDYQVPSKPESRQYTSAKRPPQPANQQDNSNAVFQVLLMELERRFEMMDDRIEKNEKLTRQANQNSTYNQDMFNQVQDKIQALSLRLQKLEHQVRVLEEYFLEHRNDTEIKFVEFNKHIDSNLKQFLNSSQNIARSVDKLTQESKEYSTNDAVQKEISLIKQKIDSISKNLTNTHETLSDQIHDISVMQKSIENIASIDIETSLTQFAQEIGILKQRQIETIHYLQTLQENISNGC